MNKKDLKLSIRYITLLFFMVLAYDITRPEWLNKVKDLDPMTISVIFGSVFGALTMVLKSHFETKIGDD